MPNIKIFVDCHVFDGGFQGTTTYIKGLYLQMVRNSKISFFFAASDIENLKHYFGIADNIHYIKYKSTNKFCRLLIDIPAIIKKYNIDYAHFQYVVPPFKLCKYITTIHDVLFLDYPDLFPTSYKIKNHFLFKLSARMSDILLSVSDYSAERIKEHFNTKEIIVTPNAVDKAYFADYDKSKVQQEVFEKYGITNYWIYVSRWEPRKNHHRLLNVFVKNKYYKDNYLVFTGDKSIQTTEFDAIYNSLHSDIREKVIILNKVSFYELLLLVRGSLLSIYPSVAEGFGIPPLETAAALIPTACSNTTAMSDFTFFKSKLFNPLSEQDILRGIEESLRIIDDLHLIRDAIQKKYNWSYSAQTLIDKITEISGRQV